MEAPIAAAAIQTLAAMAIQQLSNEASLIFNFRQDFQWVTDKLMITKTYLKDAHQKSIQNDSIKQWLRQLSDVAFDAEDILDECAVESHTKSCALSCSRLKFKLKIGRRIEDLKARMSSIVADARELELFRDLTSSEQASTSSSGAEQWRRSSILESNARPVAIEAKVDEILRLLADATHGVIGVVGMGGVGKTFLLQNVYNDPRTIASFEKCIWVSVSQTYSLKKLQSDIASSLLQSASSLDLGDVVADHRSEHRSVVHRNEWRSVFHRSEQRSGDVIFGSRHGLASNLDLRDVVAGHLSEQRAAELICSSLYGKKFLIVLDDVWNTTKHENLIQRLGVPSTESQSKIIVTTRDMAVCRVINATSIYSMKVLEEEDSWNLFCVYAFPDYPQNRPPQHLKKLARQVENKCGKLPLALKIVGASMENQTLVKQWESKLQKLKAVREPEDTIMEILQLSYDSLPADLKLCFLYFAFFGKEEKIDVEYLIQLWRAEGFIHERDDDGRDVGLKYFYQLSNLCLVEAWEDVYLNKYCKIHDLLLDLAIYICKENKCIFTLEEGTTKYSSTCRGYLSQLDKNSRYCRLFLAKQGILDGDISMLLFPRFLRTLSLRKNDKIKNIQASLFSKVRALRVLDLSNTSISTLPSSIGCLKLLRVLNLSYTYIMKVPQCIRSLKNLRVLNMLGMKCMVRVPVWIGELKYLECLVLHAESLPKTISELLSLRVLHLAGAKLSVENNGLLRLEDVGNLIHLQQLDIKISKKAELRRVEGGVLEQLVNMRWLSVSMLNYDDEISTMEDNNAVQLFPEKLTSMKHLEYLLLDRFIVPSSSWICQFVNLRVLVLRYCHWNEYPALESLPNLISLQLVSNHKCRQARESFGKSGAFPKLRFLNIEDFPMLEEFPVLQRGSMPCLEEFSLRGCKRVGIVEGLEQLRRLKVLDLRESGTDECRESLKERGAEWKNIKANNPRIHISV